MNDNLLEQARNAAGQFGFNWWQLGAQIVSLAAFGLAIAASIYCVRRHRAGSHLPLWLIFVWLVPVIGPICTFAALQRPATPP